MNRLAALGCIAVTLVFPCALSAQLPADSLSVGSAGGNGGVYAVTAYILNLNGIIGNNQVIDAKSLPKVKMPNRGGFTSDPRPAKK